MNTTFQRKSMDFLSFYSIFIFSSATFFSLTLGKCVFAGGYSLSGVGTRSIAMGGAFRGLADDWSAGYWNPAGLAQFEGLTSSLQNSSIFELVKYKPDNPTPGFDKNVELDNNMEIFNVPSFGIYKKFNKPGSGFVTGFLFYVPYGLGASWDLYDPPSGFNPSEPFPEYDHASDLTVYAFQPTFAYAVTPDLSVGAGLGILYSEIFLKKVQLVNIKQLYPVASYPLLPMATELEGNGVGFIGNFGLLYKMNPKFSLGLNIQTGTKIPLDGDATLRLYLSEEFRTATKKQGVLTSYAKGDADFPVHWIYALGANYHPRHNLKFGLDLEVIQWSVVDEIVVEMDGRDPLIGAPLPNDALVKYWDDSYRISAGAEYEVFPGYFIYGGYYHEQAPVIMETIDPLVPSFGNIDAATLGGGIRRSRFGADLVFEVHKFADTTVEKFADKNGDDIYDNLPGDYSGKVAVVNINFMLYF